MIISVGHSLSVDTSSWKFLQHLHGGPQLCDAEISLIVSHQN